jgi:hypothetical protein
MWAGLAAEKAWMYGHNTSWYHKAVSGNVHASMTQPMVLYELTSAAFFPSSTTVEVHIHTQPTAYPT